MELELWGMGLEPSRGGEPSGKMNPGVCGRCSPELAEAVQLGDGVWAMAWPLSRELWAGAGGCQL